MVDVEILGCFQIALKCKSNIDILALKQHDCFIFFLIRLFQPVQYGTKPEGRLAAITSTAGQRPPTSSPSTSTSVSTTSQSAQTRGKSPVTIATTTATSHGKTISGLEASKAQEILFSQWLQDSRRCHLTSVFQRQT